MSKNILAGLRPTILTNILRRFRNYPKFSLCNCHKEKWRTIISIFPHKICLTDHVLGLKVICQGHVTGRLIFRAARFTLLLWDAYHSSAHFLIFGKRFRLSSLYAVGIVRWIEAYLSGRLSKVNVGGERSGAIPMHSCVPQGSVIGPLLFVIDLPDVLVPLTLLFLFFILLFIFWLMVGMATRANNNHISGTGIGC